MATKVHAKQEKPVVAEARTSRGTRKTRFLRAAGKTPGVIYGLGKETLMVTLPTVETVRCSKPGRTSWTCRWMGRRKNC